MDWGSKEISLATIFLAKGDAFFKEIEHLILLSIVKLFYVLLQNAMNIYVKNQIQFELVNRLTLYWDRLYNYNNESNKSQSMILAYTWFHIWL